MEIFTRNVNVPNASVKLICMVVPLWFNKNTHCSVCTMYAFVNFQMRLKHILYIYHDIFYSLMRSVTAFFTMNVVARSATNKALES